MSVLFQYEQVLKSHDILNNNNAAPFYFDGHMTLARKGALDNEEHEEIVSRPNQEMIMPEYHREFSCMD